MEDHSGKSNLSSTNRAVTGRQVPLNLSVTFLIAANLIPLFGAIFWHWQVFEIVLLYWVENIIVGLVNAVRLMCIRDASTGPLKHLANVFQTGFFLVHYGLFTVVHGVFVFALLGGGFGGERHETDLYYLFHQLKWAILALVVSHTISFFFNFLGKKEYLKRTLNEQMMAPYPRMVALHIAIVFGAFAVQALGQPVVLLAILVIGKTAVDWRLHVRSHRKVAEKEAKHPDLP